MREVTQETAKIPSCETVTDGVAAEHRVFGETVFMVGHVSPPSWDTATLTSAAESLPDKNAATTSLRKAAT